MKCVFLLFENEFRLLFVTSVEDHNRNTFPVTQRNFSAFCGMPSFLALPKF